MAPLRFRAWDGTRNNWLHSPDMPISLVGEVVMSGMVWVRKDDSVVRMEEMHEIIFEQSTGLKDKNGKKIFEGDILGYYFEDEPEMTILGPVKWRTKICAMAVDIGLALTTVEPEDLWANVEFEGKSSYEVIGNVHENPELLS